jgi:hypothetical protein
MTEFSEADLAYIRGNYVPLAELCAERGESVAEVETLIDERRLPHPSYVLDDGTALFPCEYFRLVDEAGGVDELPEHFAAVIARQRALIAGSATSWSKT